MFMPIFCLISMNTNGLLVQVILTLICRKGETLEELVLHTGGKWCSAYLLREREASHQTQGINWSECVFCVLCPWQSVWQVSSFSDTAQALLCRSHCCRRERQKSGHPVNNAVERFVDSLTLWRRSNLQGCILLNPLMRCTSTFQLVAAEPGHSSVL